MDNDTNSNNRTTLHQPFIETANALASLYKQAAAAERDARDSGAASAYRTIMQWAATKSTSGEQITPADVISLCATGLSRTHRSNVVTQPSDRSIHSSPSNNDQSSRIPESNSREDTPSVAYVARDDALVSDIRKLNVNPRKRQRVDISDTFIKACRSNEALIFEPAEDSPNPFRLQPESPATPNSRREAAKENGLFSSQHTDFNPSRKSKHVKAQFYDKLRKK